MLVKNVFASLLLIVLQIGIGIKAHARAGDQQVALISVNGMVERSLDPNILIVSLEVWSKSNQAKEAQSTLAKQFQSVQNVIEKFKIKKEDWQTSQYQLTPENEYDPKTQKVKQVGYKASQNITLTFRQISEAGNFLDQMIQEQENTKKGTSVLATTWDSDQKSIIESKALAAAYQNAKLRADSLAAAASVKIKRPFHIQNSSQFAGTEAQVNISERASMMALRSKSADFTPTQIIPGQIKINATVQVDFEIE